MKYSYLFLLCFISMTIHAQIEEGSYDTSLGKQNGFMMDHVDADKKMVEKVFENFFKDYGKINRNRKAKEWTCEKCLLTQIDQDPLNIYYKIEEGKGLVTSYVFFDDGFGFLKSSDAINNLLMNVNYEVQRAVLRDEIEDQEKDLSSFEKDLGKLVKKNQGLHEDIEDYKAKIQKAEKDIEKNLHEQADKKMQIEKQKINIQNSTKKLNEVGRSS